MVVGVQARLQPPRPKASPSGRKRGGQPGQRRVHRAPLPAEQVDESVAGSRFAERLLTMVASCRQQGRPVLDFLVATVEAALRGSSPPSLLPAPQGAERFPRSIVTSGGMA